MGDTAEAPPPEEKAEEPPKEEAAKEEAPKEEAPKEEAPKEEAPKEEAPKEEAPKEEPPKEEAPKEEAPKEEAPKEEAPKEEAPKEEAPKEEAPKEEAPKEEAPKEEAPKEEAPKEEGVTKQAVEAEAKEETAKESELKSEATEIDQAQQKLAKEEKEKEKEDKEQAELEGDATKEGEEGEEKKKSETTVGGAEEEKPKEKDATSEQRSAQDVSQQRSSKLSISSLGKRQSGEDSKDMFVRRKSTRSIKNAVGSIVSFRRGSIAEYFDRQKTVKFMNTYKLDSDKPFNVDAVTKILEEVLIEALENLTYDVDKVPKQAKWATSAIRAKVKEQEFDRYKIICIVTIGEKRSQDMFSTYRFLWDVDRDKHASFVHENMYVFAIACCFGLYYE